MDWFHAFWLAVVQGLTEFLPISSSAHLILLPVIAAWPDQGLDFDVAVHVGTLVAVLAYFRREVWAMARDWSWSLSRRRRVGESRLAWYVILATVPIFVAGLLLGDEAETVLRSPLIIAWATVGFGVLLWLADRYFGGERDEAALRLSDALLIGCAQVLAIVPGTSRSGITITAALLLGTTPTAAARFSFLLSIPTIALAGAWKGLELTQRGGVEAWETLLFGALVSGVAAYACIGVFLALLERIGMTPFVIYRLLLGGLLLVVFL